MDGGDAADFRDAADASDAADTGPISLPTSEILGGEPAFAARAGYFGSEQVWLFGISGKAVLVSTWPPSSSLSCGPDPQVDYTGYPDRLGRFGPLQFDHSGRYLLFSETLDRGVCPTSPGRTDSRWIAHDIQTGTSHVLPAQGSVQVAEGATVLVAETELYDFVNGNLTRIPTVSRASSALTSPRLVWHAGAPLLVAPGIQPMRRSPTGFVTTNVLDAVGGDLIGLVTASGDALCGMRELPGDSGSRLETFLLEAEGALSPVPSCLLSADSSLAFVQDASGTRAVTRDGTLVTDLPGVWMHGIAHGAAWGIRGIEIVRWDLTSHVLTSVADAGAIGCGFAPDAGEAWNAAVHRLYLPGAQGRTALVKVHCGAVDSDDARTFALRLDTLETTAVEREQGEHHVYGVTPLASGGFVLTSSMYQGFEATVPAPGSYFRVDEDGQAALVGPVAGVDGVIHSPQSPAMWGHVRVGGGNDVWSP
jgi:hypothetical protein